MSRWQPPAPKTAAVDWQRHVDLCEVCRYYAKPCEVGQSLYRTWEKLAHWAMHEIWRK